MNKIKSLVSGWTAKEFGILNLGTILMAIGIYFFKFPNHFSTGGVSGIAVILGGIIPSFTPGMLVFGLNMLLLVVGLIFFGKGFGLKTAYSSILFSCLTWVLEIVYPMTTPFTSQPLLELVFAIMLPAAGSALLFNIGASSGGTDVIAMMLKKYTNCNIGMALLYTDIVIVASCFFVFGMETGLFSLTGLFAKTLVVDNVIESINLCKYFTIITDCPDEVCNYIVNSLGRGATRLAAEGAFTSVEKTMVITVVGRSQAVALRNAVKSIDDKAFMMITNTSEIIGKGFRGVA